MKLKKIFKNDDAVSISIGFILMFAVTVIVFSLLIISFYSLSQRIEKNAMQESFKTVGNGLVIKMTALDTLVNTTDTWGGTTNILDYRFTIPESIAGKSYTVNITTDQIILEADNGAKITIPYNTTTNFTETKLYSGAEDYRFRFNMTSNAINIE